MEMTNVLKLTNKYHGAVEHYSCFVHGLDTKGDGIGQNPARFQIPAYANERDEMTVVELLERAFYLSNGVGGGDKIVPQYPSMTAGDVVVFTPEGTEDRQHWFCNSTGWKQITVNDFARWGARQDAMVRQRMFA